jgi:hypothetical protein
VNAQGATPPRRADGRNNRINTISSPRRPVGTSRRRHEALQLLEPVLHDDEAQQCGGLKNARATDRRSLAASDFSLLMPSREQSGAADGIDLAHAARADLRGHFVDAEAGAWSEGQSESAYFLRPAVQLRITVSAGRVG